MKNGLAAFSLSFAIASPTLAQETLAPVVPGSLGAVAPALEAFTRDELFGTVWAGETLSPRDRALVTLSALITRHETEALADYVALALDSGVTPAEISETITHLAFYTGWQNGMAAAEATAPVYAARGIGAEALPATDPAFLPLDKAGEDRRQSRVEELYGDVSQGVVDNTERLLFLDLWLRPALAPRDRSLVTVAALIAGSKTEQMPFHLNRAMDNGLTKDEASAMLAHLAFYAGWPNVFSAMPVAKQVFESRGS